MIERVERHHFFFCVKVIKLERVVDTVEREIAITAVIALH